MTRLQYANFKVEHGWVSSSPLTLSIPPSECSAHLAFTYYLHTLLLYTVETIALRSREPVLSAESDRDEQRNFFSGHGYRSCQEEHINVT